MFDLLSFPPQTIDDPSLLTYPNNKSKMLLEKVEARKADKDKQRATNEKKKKRNAKKLPTGTALDKDMESGGQGDQVADMKRDVSLVTKSIMNKINFEEKLCTFTQYHLISKANQIQTLKDNRDGKLMLFLDRSNDFGHPDGSLVGDTQRNAQADHDSMEAQKQGLEDELRLKRDAVAAKLMLEQADQLFQSDELKKILNIVLDRVMTDDDKQYKLDVEDIIEEQLYQCVQFFNKDNFADKFGGDENKDGDDKMRAKTNQATNFLNSLGTGNGLDQANALLVVMQRELINKGNYQAIDGECISVKKFLRDWNTDNLYNTL